MSNSNNLELPFLAAAQNQKHITLNESLSKLDMMVQLSVISKNLMDKPLTPIEGARYIIGDAALNDWSGLSGKIAYFQDAIWHYISPKEGWFCWVEDIQKYYIFTQSVWVEQYSKKQFLQPDFYVCEEAAYRQEAALAPNTGWNYRALNLVKRNILGAEAILDVGQRAIKLPVGKYWVKTASAAMQVDSHKADLKNIDTGQHLIAGNCEYSQYGATSTASLSRSEGQGVLDVVNNTHRFCLNHYVDQGGVENWRFGPSGEGTPINSQIQVWRL